MIFDKVQVIQIAKLQPKSRVIMITEKEKAF